MLANISIFMIWQHFSKDEFVSSFDIMYALPLGLFCHSSSSASYGVAKRSPDSLTDCGRKGRYPINPFVLSWHLPLPGGSSLVTRTSAFSARSLREWPLGSSYCVDSSPDNPTKISLRPISNRWKCLPQTNSLPQTSSSVTSRRKTILPWTSLQLQSSSCHSSQRTFKDGPPEQSPSFGICGIPSVNTNFWYVCTSLDT